MTTTSLPAAVFYDQTANEVVVVCTEYFPDDDSSYLTDVLRLRATPVISQRDSLGQISSSIVDEGFVNPVDGTLWLPLPNSSDVRFYDRTHTTFREQPVSVPLRRTVTR